MQVPDKMLFKPSELYVCIVETQLRYTLVCGDFNVRTFRLLLINRTIRNV